MQNVNLSYNKNLYVIRLKLHFTIRNLQVTKQRDTQFILKSLKKFYGKILNKEKWFYMKILFKIKILFFRKRLNIWTFFSF